MLVWPIPNLINLFYIPLRYRVLFVNSLGFFWNIYVNWYAHYVLKPNMLLEHVKHVK